MGQPVSLPVVISPTGVQAVHPDGEVAVARTAAVRGTVMSLSSFASKPIEEVVAANPQTFSQAYWVGTREQMVAHIERARTAGAVGLILTLDWTFTEPRQHRVGVAKVGTRLLQPHRAAGIPGHWARSRLDPACAVVTPPCAWEGVLVWFSGPRRSRAPPTIAPPAKMPAVHQNAVS